MNELMPEISLVMIVKNAGQQLVNAIESAKIFCDDIIVVDTGSDDNTPNIAAKLGTKLFFKKWNDDFSEARNFAIKHALNEWILILDHDEIIDSESLLSEIELFNDDDVGGIRVNIKNINQINNTSTTHSYTRIFRNSKGIKFAGKIHEQINQSVLNAGFKIVDSKIEIIHFGYIDNNHEKSLRNQELLLDELKINPEDDYSKYQYANTVFSLQDYKSFLEMSEELFASNTLSFQQKELLLVRKAQSHLALNQIEETILLSKTVLKDSDYQGFMMYIRAAALMQLHRFEDAYNLYTSPEVINSEMTDKSIIESATIALKNILFS